MLLAPLLFKLDLCACFKTTVLFRSIDFRFIELERIRSGGVGSPDVKPDLSPRPSSFIGEAAPEEYYGVYWTSVPEFLTCRGELWIDEKTETSLIVSFCNLSGSMSSITMVMPLLYFLNSSSFLVSDGVDKVFRSCINIFHLTEIL